MGEEDPLDPEWSTPSEASAATGVPERTIWRWAKGKQIASRTTAGVTEVRVPDVQARLAAREAAKASTAASQSAGGATAGAPAGANVGGGSGIGGVAASRLDGDLTSRIFGLLDEGLSPVVIVRQEHLPASVVLQAVKERRALAALSGPEGPSREEIAERLGQAEENLRGVVSTVQGNADWYEGRVNGVTAQLAELEAGLLELNTRLRSAEQLISWMIGHW